MPVNSHQAAFDEIRAAAEALLQRARRLPPDEGDGAWPADQWGAAFATARLLAETATDEEAALARFGMRVLVAWQSLLAAAEPEARARLRLLGATVTELRARSQAGTALALAAIVAEMSGDGSAVTLLPLFSALESLMSCGLAATMGPAGREVAPVYWRLALEAARGADSGPAVVLCGGLSGSGKSFVANGVAAAIGARVLVADAERKRMLELPLTARTPDEQQDAVYSVATSNRVYARLLAAAEAEVAAGRSVVLDATYLTRARRQPALDLAMRLQAPAIVIWCSVDQRVATARLARRASDRWTVSDADAAVRAAQQAGLEEPVDGERGASLLPVETSMPPGELFERLLPQLRHLTTAGPPADS
jgi:predicted kinase